MTVVIFLIVLAALIFVHELGHFLVAKWNGIRVDEFKIGFGPRIIRWKWGETEYGVNIIPFGGFVKIYGENPDEKSIFGPDSGRSFVNKNRWRQASVLVAGVFFNFLFAWLLYIIIFASGVTATKEGFERYAEDFKNDRIMVTYVEKNSPAEMAGLKTGDVIKEIVGLAASGKALDLGSESANKETIGDIQETIAGSAGEPITVLYSRSQLESEIEITPVKGLVADKYAIGIGMQEVGDLKLPIVSSIYEGANYTVIMTRETVIGLYSFAANIFAGTANFSDVAGPVGIAGIVGDAAALGFAYLLMITALISINLSIINLLPFPALDGGRILFVAIEGLIRRRISYRFTNAVNAVGFVLLMALMVVVTYNDIARLVK